MRAALAELLPRWLAILLRIRRVTPVGRYWPRRSVQVEPVADTGGTFRAAWRQQDPAVDPREPYGGESSSTGNDHGWSGCTCTAAALAIAYQQPRGSLAPWGGDMRHSGQPDLSGGTDLYDMRAAWSEYGETLNIRSGAGWSAVVTAHDEGRAIVIQGTGNVPGSESFDGGHACAIAPETHSDGRWLFGDPLASGWQWIPPADIRKWAERWQSSVAFATGEKPPSSPPPTPAPGQVADYAPPPNIGAELRRAEGYAASLALDGEVGAWLVWLGPAGPIAGAVWSASTWPSGELASLARLLDGCDDDLAVWSRGPILDPVAAAQHARATPALWGVVGWRELVWH